MEGFTLLVFEEAEEAVDDDDVVVAVRLVEAGVVIEILEGEFESGVVIGKVKLCFNCSLESK